MTGNQFLTTGQIAARFGVHPSTVHRWIEAGLLTPDLDANGRRLFRLSTVAEFEMSRAAVQS